MQIGQSSAVSGVQDTNSPNWSWSLATCYIYCLNCRIGILKECLIFIPPIYILYIFWKVLSSVIGALIFLAMRGAMQFILPCFITFWHCVSFQSSVLFHPALPGLVIKWAQLKFTLQVVPAAPGVSANASFHFTARVISTQQSAPAGHCPWWFPNFGRTKTKRSLHNIPYCGNEDVRNSLPFVFSKDFDFLPWIFHGFIATSRV